MKKIFLLAALASVVLTGCKKEDPFDTQSADDQPQILRPYNESGSGSFTYTLANPDTPLLDSATVTPSAYTTVYWYLNGTLVHTGTRIEKYFVAGEYELKIEAVTTADKRTHRTGTVTVHPYAEDPYSPAPISGRHVVPGVVMPLNGSNLDKVAELVLTNDLFGTKVACTCTPSAKTATQLTYTLPAIEDGKYYLRLKDADGKAYGSGLVITHNGAVVLDGYQSFVPNQEWVITGVNLAKVKSVKVDETVITELTATETSVTFTAPSAEIGEHMLSMLNEDGSAVLFVTSEGTVEQVTTIVSAETTLWTGPVTIDWNADLVKIDATTMAQVSVGSTILIYFDIPEAEYHALRVTTPWWDGYDLVPQIDGFESKTSPFEFTYTDDCKTKVETCGAMSVVGFGVTVNKITFK